MLQARWIHLLLIFPFAFSACVLIDRGGTEDDEGRPRGRSKTVKVRTFKRMVGKPYNFETENPDMLAVSSGILYTGLSAGMTLHAWKIDKSDVEEAWSKLDDFQGSSSANFDLNGESRRITGLLAIANGVAVAVSDDTAKPRAVIGSGADSGLAIFAGQEKKAAQSFSLMSNRGRHGFWAIALAQATTSNTRSIYIIAERNDYNDRFVLWVNLIKPTDSAQGLIWSPEGHPRSSLKFGRHSENLWLPHGNNNITAMAPLPDGRMALAKPEGLLTIKKESVGVANNLDPMLEQKDPDDVLDEHHATSWRTEAGGAPTRVSAMRLIGNQFLVIGFSDDGTGNGGMKYADATKNPMVFTTNVDAPAIQVKNVVAHNNEALIVTTKAIYTFASGVFAVELDAAKLKDDMAYLNTGVKGKSNDPDPLPLNYDNFRGGNLGDVPEKNVKFHDAAAYGDTWYIATDQGLFNVRFSQETRTFEKL